MARPMSARAATPPTTPPTMAPVGVELLELPPLLPPELLPELLAAGAIVVVEVAAGSVAITKPEVVELEDDLSEVEVSSSSSSVLELPPADEVVNGS